MVLFDEICAGTDPVEGAALAISILTFLHNMKVRTMTTTHYSELKLFALSTDGIENACCEFSVETLSPTYRLLIGIPGKSNAFAISAKLGLPGYLIEDAKKRIDSDNEAFEDILTDLEQSKVKIQQEEAEITRNRAEIADLKSELESKTERLQNQREQILREANEEAARILSDAKDFADETIKKINKLSKGANINHKDLENERHKVRNKMNEAQSKLALKNTKKQAKKYTAKDFKPGDSVKVLSLNLKGTICVGTVIFTILCLVTPLTNYVAGFSGSSITKQIANMHTLFNISTTILLIPFGNYLAKLATKILPEKEEEKEHHKHLKYIKSVDTRVDATFGTSAINLQNLRNEIQRMLEMARVNVEESFDAFLAGSSRLLGDVDKREDYIDYLNKEISRAAAKMMAHETNVKASKNIGSYLDMTSNIERIGDHRTMADHERVIGTA